MKRFFVTVVTMALMPTAALLPATAWAAETPGQHFQLSPDRLAAPYATPATASRSIKVPLTPVTSLILPAGFTSNIFAEGLTHARWLAVAPNGDVFLSEASAGKITLLRDADHDGKAETITTYAERYERPSGLAFHQGALYVGDIRGVWRIPYRDGDTRAPAGTMLTAPGAFGAGAGNHWTRNIAVSPHGEIVVSIGSASNVAEERAPRASIQTLKDGKFTPYGTGLRNPVGVVFYPGTEDLYTVVNERDGLGDGLVPDYLTRVERGGFYGWPYAYIGKHPDPQFGAKRPDLVAATKVPDVLFQAHSAALGLAFYTATQFPERFRGGAFVAFHGSWNASKPTGYKVVYVPFRDKRPEGGYENFALGFWVRGDADAEVIGRPVGLVVAQDGSLLIADDVANVVWRVSYAAK